MVGPFNYLGKDRDLKGYPEIICLSFAEGYILMMLMMIHKTTPSCVLLTMVMILWWYKICYLQGC